MKKKVILISVTPSSDKYVQSNRIEPPSSENRNTTQLNDTQKNSSNY